MVPFHLRRIQLEVSSNLRTVLPIGVTKLVLEVALLAQDNPAMHDDEKRDQHDYAPPSIDGQSETEIEERQGYIEGIARESKRAGSDNGRGGACGIHVRTCSLQRFSSRYRDPNAKDDQREAEPESNGVIKNWHRPEPMKHKSNGEGGAIEQRRPRDDSRVVCWCGHKEYPR